MFFYIRLFFHFIVSLGCCRPVRVHLREAADRADEVQVRDHVRQVRIEAGPQRKVLREQHRPTGELNHSVLVLFSTIFF